MDDFIEEHPDITNVWDIPSERICAVGKSSSIFTPHDLRYPIILDSQGKVFQNLLETIPSRNSSRLIKTICIDDASSIFVHSHNEAFGDQKTRVSFLRKQMYRGGGPLSDNNRKRLHIKRLTSPPLVAKYISHISSIL